MKKTEVTRTCYFGKTGGASVFYTHDPVRFRLFVVNVFRRLRCVLQGFDLGIGFNGTECVQMISGPARGVEAADEEAEEGCHDGNEDVVALQLMRGDVRHGLSVRC